MGFELDAQLANDTVELGQLGLSRVLLMKDANYPWIILVPERLAITELYELDEDDQLTLMSEITALTQGMKQIFSADKMNVANLGNMVPQLHIHLIARFKNDPAWPGPVWGAVERKAYEEDALAQRVAVLRQLVASESKA